MDTIAKHRAIPVEALLLEWGTATTQPNPPSFVRGMRESMLRLPRPQGSFSALWKSFFADASSSATSQAKESRGRGTEGKGSGVDGERTEKGRVRWQHFLAKDAWRQEFERLSVAFLPGALHKRELRRLVARCLPHAGRAMRVLPSRRGLQLEEQEARDWLAWSFSGSIRST